MLRNSKRSKAFSNKIANLIKYNLLTLKEYKEILKLMAMSSSKEEIIFLSNLQSTKRKIIYGKC
jgi:hypothetical protein